MKYNLIVIVFLCLLTFSCSVDADLVFAVQQIEASNNNDDIAASDNNSEEDVDTSEDDSEVDTDDSGDDANDSDETEDSNDNSDDEDAEDDADNDMDDQEDDSGDDANDSDETEDSEGNSDNEDSDSNMDDQNDNSEEDSNDDDTDANTDSMDDDSQSSTSPLVGVWVMVDVVFEEDPNDTSLNLADEVVDHLVAEDCFLVTFTFNEDGTVTSQNSINFLEINAGPTGLVVPCPENSDDRAGTWSLEGNQLLFVYDNGSQETLTIVLEEDSLIFAGILRGLPRN